MYNDRQVKPFSHGNLTSLPKVLSITRLPVESGFFMGNKAITLPIEYWDRLIEILDFIPSVHPDVVALKKEINGQLHYNPADVQEYL